MKTIKTGNYILICGLLGCCVAVAVAAAYLTTAATAFAQTTATVPARNEFADNEYQTGAVLYMQKAAEYRALAYQAFNLARLSLDADQAAAKNLSRAERKKPKAIMVDIDETVLDNSPQQAFSILNRQPFNLPDWYAWGERREAKAIPGAIDFLDYANRRGVRIFYSSNRDEVQKTATIDNLKKVGFPDVGAETVLLRTNDSSKEARRQMISSRYRLVLLLGDNLNDFSAAFERKSVEARFAETDRFKSLWGTRWIVLPNATYGDWENAIYDYRHLTEPEKTERRKNALMAY